MIKTTLVQYSIQHVSAMKTKSPKIPITRKEVVVGMKGFDCFDFNNQHHPLVLNKVVQDTYRKDRVVIWCGKDERAEDIALLGIKGYYKDALRKDIEISEKNVIKSKERLDICDELFMIRKGG